MADVAASITAYVTALGHPNDAHLDLRTGGGNRGRGAVRGQNRSALRSAASRRPVTVRGVI